MKGQIILLAGNNSYALRKEKKKMIQSFLSENPAGNVSRFVLEANPDWLLKEKIKNKLFNSSLFSSKELVVIKLQSTQEELSLPEEKNSSSPKEPAPKEKKEDNEVFLTSILENVPKDFQVIVDTDKKIRKNSPWQKMVSKGLVSLKEFNLNPKEDSFKLREEIKKFLLEEQIVIGNYLLNELISSKGGNYWSIFSCLQQASLLLHSLSERQNDEKVAALWDLQENQNVFRFLDAVGNKDQKASLTQLYKIVEENKLRFPDEITVTLGLFSLIRKQVEHLLLVKEGLPLQKAEGDWKIKPFVFFKAKRQSSQFRREFLIFVLEKIAELQEKAKSGLVSPLPLLDFLVFRLISH